MKITLFELLGLIKDGKAPQKIKYEYSIYELTPEMNDYYCKNEMRWFTNEINSLGVLNEDVEIIEETKKIEKIDFGTLNTQKEKNRVMKDTINKLIDEINNLKEK